MMLVNVDAEQIVDELKSNPELIMDGLASFAQHDARVNDALIRWIAEADSGSIYHRGVLPWLRRLVVALEQNGTA
jgi:hypothetical protein